MYTPAGSEDLLLLFLADRKIEEEYCSFIHSVTDENTEILFATESFVSAAILAQKKLWELLHSEQGAFLKKGPLKGVIIRRQVVYFYSTCSVPGWIDFMAFKDKNLICASIGERPLFVQEPYDLGEEDADAITGHIALCLLFKKFAKVEIKQLPPKSRKKEFNCKYVNDTDNTIQILDSTWFTTLVKSDAFKVRGHFRLQPKKDDNGNWTKELIWIKDFQKSGYTASAKKLSLEQ